MQAEVSDNSQRGGEQMNKIEIEWLTNCLAKLRDIFAKQIGAATTEYGDKGMDECDRLIDIINNPGG
jgi:hypothetical protein